MRTVIALNSENKMNKSSHQVNWQRLHQTRTPSNTVFLEPLESPPVHLTQDLDPCSRLCRVQARYTDWQIHHMQDTYLLGSSRRTEWSKLLKLGTCTYTPSVKTGGSASYYNSHEHNVWAYTNPTEWTTGTRHQWPCRQDNGHWGWSLLRGSRHRQLYSCYAAHSTTKKNISICDN